MSAYIAAGIVLGTLGYFVCRAIGACIKGFDAFIYWHDEKHGYKFPAERGCLDKVPLVGNETEAKCCKK